MRPARALTGLVLSIAAPAASGLTAAPALAADASVSGDATGSLAAAAVLAVGAAGGSWLLHRRDRDRP
ncbi:MULTISPECIES: hypothetical protein [Streptomyces]|uniref:hypothetical protein n=1 Tax=Streptomyces TaxID=1883 RepID=UPI0030F478D8